MVIPQLQRNHTIQGNWGVDEAEQPCLRLGPSINDMGAK